MRFLLQKKANLLEIFQNQPTTKLSLSEWNNDIDNDNSVVFFIHSLQNHMQNNSGELDIYLASKTKSQLANWRIFLNKKMPAWCCIHAINLERSDLLAGL